jgi:hypothetical protein
LVISISEKIGGIMTEEALDALHNWGILTGLEAMTTEEGLHGINRFVTIEHKKIGGIMAIEEEVAVMLEHEKIEGKMTIEDLQKIIIKNFTTEDGTIDIIGLEFNDDVDMSNLKVGGTLFQLWQDIDGHLCQSWSKIGRNSYQSGQKIEGDLYRVEQIVGGDICEELTIINGISEHELCERNKKTRIEYLNECLSLIEQGLFNGDAIDILNRCVGECDRLDDIDSSILFAVFHEEGANGTLIRELENIKKDGYVYVNQDFNGFKFSNDKEIINYAIDNCV